MKKQSNKNQSGKTADKIADEMEEHGKKLLQTAKILRGERRGGNRRTHTRIS